ncbi:MAG: hypothetical protein KBS59_00310 [Clostridiales bacterium]|nr:hypothetical protein [Clostridiales bacterium]
MKKYHIEIRRDEGDKWREFGDLEGVSVEKCRESIINFAQKWGVTIAPQNLKIEECED